MQRSGELVVFYSDNDGDPSVQDSALRILRAAPTAKSRVFQLGHFGHWDMPRPEFPDLLSEVLDLDGTPPVVSA